MKLTLSKPNRNMTQPEITNIDNNVLNIEGVLEDIMSQHGPHLWEKQLLEIVTQYDDKNNRTRIYTYRKAIVLLQDRLHKKDDPHMIRVIIKKILKSYKKRLDVALDTLTSTPPSSDDENADNDTDNCFNILPYRPPSVYEVSRKVDETHSVETTNKPQKNVKDDQNTFMEVNNIKKIIKMRFVCDVCYEKFSTSVALNRHLLTCNALTKEVYPPENSYISYDDRKAAKYASPL